MNNLRDCRVKQLMTQKELSRASGVCQVTISFTENQVSEPMDLTKQKLSRALKVPLEKLFPVNAKTMSNLRNRRVEKRMSQMALAKLSGISQVTISFIESELSEPRDITKEKLARALGISAEELFPPVETI